MTAGYVNNVLAVHHDELMRMFRAELLTNHRLPLNISRVFVLPSSLLVITLAASNTVNVVCKTEIADGLSTNIHMVVLKSWLLSCAVFLGNNVE